MAFGNNQQNNGKNVPTYYSRFRVYNPDEKLTISVNFWNGMMKISLDQFIQNGYNQYGSSSSRDEVVAVYVSPIKARLFAKCIDDMLADSKDCSYGIDTGTGDIRGLIVIGRKSGVPFIGLGKVNSDGGYENYQEYKFAKDMYYRLNIKDVQKLKFDKIIEDTVELEQLRNAAIEFANAMNGAYAYSVHDIGRYEHNRSNNLLQSIADAVGVTRNSKSSKGNSFFEGSNKSTGGNTTGNGAPEGYINLDDLEDELG